MCVIGNVFSPSFSSRCYIPHVRTVGAALLNRIRCLCTVVGVIKCEEKVHRVQGDKVNK